MAAWVLQPRTLSAQPFRIIAQTASYSVAYVLAAYYLRWSSRRGPVLDSIMYAVLKEKDAAHIFMLVFRW